MPNPSELGNTLLECLNEFSAMLEKAHAVALKQQDALIQNDAELITLTYKAQDEILRKVSELDQRAAAIASELAQTAGLDPETAEAGEVAKAAGYPYTDFINEEMNRIAIYAEKVHKANEINHTLLQNGLDIIACCLRTIACEPSPTAYSQDASFKRSQVSSLSLDLRA